MSHEIETLFYYGETPWHGLGVNVEEALTSAEALIKAGLDWEVELKPVYVNTKRFTLVPDVQAIVRKTDNKPLGIMGNRYQPIQNSDAFRFFDELTLGKFAMYHTAGSLRGGKRIWILAKLPGVIQIRDDVVDKYLLLYNSFDGTTPFSVQFTPVRVVCMNTLITAIGQSVGTSFSTRHTTRIMQRVNNARTLLGLSNQFYINFQEIAARMSVLALPSPKLENYISLSLDFDLKEKAEWKPMQEYAFDRVTELVEIGKTTSQTKGTLWGAYNAITEYVDHYKKSQDRVNRFEFSLLGNGAKVKQNAFDEALKLIR